jgi:hypothetical protein
MSEYVIPDDENSAWWTEADSREAEAALQRAVAWATSPIGTAYGAKE